MFEVFPEQRVIPVDTFTIADESVAVIWTPVDPKVHYQNVEVLTYLRAGPDESLRK